MTDSVLVTAATGTVGRHVVDALEGAGVRALAASRDPERAPERFDTPVEFDFARPETWGRALEGVDGLFLVRPPGVATGSVTGFAEAAARVGVERVVYLSTLGADRNPLIPHHRTERRIAGLDPEHCFLRASYFCQNLHAIHGRWVRERDELFVPAGSGATSFVDARDVGAAAAAVLTTAAPEESYDVTGPEALTYAEVAEAFGDVLGREIRYPAPSIPHFLARELRAGRPPGFALLMCGIYTTARLGLADRVSDDLPDLLDRPPRTVRDYVTDYADRFRPAGATTA